jgi:5-methylcytosine-specific restriction endonuclease McrA
MFGRTFCSKKCFWGGQAITVTEIYRRDRAICHLCGLYVKREDASRDHVKPRHDGGRTTFENIKLAHRDCNSRRGHMPVKAYKELWERLLDERDAREREKKEKGNEQRR